MESVNSGTFQQYVGCLNGTFHEIKHPQVRIAGQNSCLRHRTAPTIASREAAVAAAAAVREAADAVAAAREAVDTAAAAARDAPASTTAASMTAALVAGCHDARVAALATAAGEAAPVAVAAMADWVATEAEIIPAVHRAATTAARIATMDLRATDAVAASRGDAVKAAAPSVAIASVRAAMAGGASLADAGAQAAAAMAATTVLACNPPNTLAADNTGDNSLHYVARSGNLRLLCQLIALIAEGAHGHDKVKALVRKPNARGETVLHETIVSGNKGMVELLMWVDPELAEFPAAAGNGDSPLYLAISLGDEDIVRILTAQSKKQIPCFGPAEQNGLHAAVFRGKGMTKAVLDSSERNLSEETDNNDSSPLHFVVSVAVQYFRMWGLRIGGKRWVSQLPTQDVLLNEKSAAHKMDKQGLYPVHVAAKMNRVDAIDIMLKTCPDSVFLRDDNGRTFLHTAVEQESLSVMDPRGRCLGYTRGVGIAGFPATLEHLLGTLKYTSPDYLVFEDAYPPWMPPAYWVEIRIMPRPSDRIQDIIVYRATEVELAEVFQNVAHKAITGINRSTRSSHFSLVPANGGTNEPPLLTNPLTVEDCQASELVRYTNALETAYRHLRFRYEQLLSRQRVSLGALYPVKEEVRVKRPHSDVDGAYSYCFDRPSSPPDSCALPKRHHLEYCPNPRIFIPPLQPSLAERARLSRQRVEYLGPGILPIGSVRRPHRPRTLDDVVSAHPDDRPDDTPYELI
ncbi:hypothetical protein ACQ4PT_050689 [Festuca glaucescens]